LLRPGGPRRARPTRPSTTLAALSGLLLLARQLPRRTTRRLLPAAERSPVSPGRCLWLRAEQLLPRPHSTRRGRSATPGRVFRPSSGNWLALDVNAALVSRKWEFQARFRRHAFGWRSQPAILRVKQAVTGIPKAARRDAVLAAEGAVLLLERISPALENVDSSSGAIGTAVNHAIARLVPIIADAPADVRTRERWLERLWEAYQADEI